MLGESILYSSNHKQQVLMGSSSPLLVGVRITAIAHLVIQLCNGSFTRSSVALLDCEPALLTYSTCNAASWCDRDGSGQASRLRWAGVRMQHSAQTQPSAFQDTLS